MKKWMFSMAALVAVGLVSLAVAGDKSKGDKAGPVPGDQAPAFALQDQNGKTVNLSDYSGKVVVLEWFNNECPFVVKHYRDGNMNALAKQYTDKGVVWLAIDSSSHHDATNSLKVAADWKMDRLILSDPTGATGHAYGSRNTPTMYIVGKDGKLAYRGAIDSVSDSETSSIAGATNYVSKALDELLAGKSVSEPMTKAYGCSVKYAKN